MRNSYRPVNSCSLIVPDRSWSNIAIIRRIVLMENCDEKERAEEAVARKKKEAAAEEERKAVEGPLKDGSELEVAPPSMHDYADNTLDSKSEEEKAQEAATAGDKTKRNQISRNYVRVDQVYPTHTTTLIMTSWLDAQFHQYRQQKKPKGRR